MCLPTRRGGAMLIVLAAACRSRSNAQSCLGGGLGVCSLSSYQAPAHVPAPGTVPDGMQHGHDHPTTRGQRSILNTLQKKAGASCTLNAERWHAERLHARTPKVHLPLCHEIRATVTQFGNAALRTRLRASVTKRSEATTLPLLQKRVAPWTGAASKPHPSTYTACTVVF